MDNSMNEDDYGSLREKNISERNAFFADFFKEFEKETSEIKTSQKKRWSESNSENQPPKKKRRTIAGDSSSFQGSRVRVEFCRRYNTRSKKKMSYTDELNDSDDEHEYNESSKDNRPRLKVLFPWAKPFQRDIDLMKIVCDQDEENKSDDEYSDDTFDDNTRKKRYRVRLHEYDPDSIPSVDEITEKMLNNVAKKCSEKVYCKVKGTCCHQCRQKTLDTKTVCRSGECIGIRGLFCGPCLRGRYGENAVQALKDPNWACPPCRGLCNCSICRNRNGLRPTGQMATKVQDIGYSSVKDYLQAAELEDM